MNQYSILAPNKIIPYKVHQLHFSLRPTESSCNSSSSEIYSVFVVHDLISRSSLINFVFISREKNGFQWKSCDKQTWYLHQTDDCLCRSWWRLKQNLNKSGSYTQALGCERKCHVSISFPLCLLYANNARRSKNPVTLSQSASNA